MQIVFFVDNSLTINRTHLRSLHQHHNHTSQKHDVQDQCPDHWRRRCRHNGCLRPRNRRQGRSDNGLTVQLRHRPAERLHHRLDPTRPRHQKLETFTLAQRRPQRPRHQHSCIRLHNSSNEEYSRRQTHSRRYHLTSRHSQQNNNPPPPKRP